MNTIFRIFSFVSLMSLSSLIRASGPSKIKLFTHGSFAPGYDAIIEEIISGKEDFTHLVFSNCEFPFKGLLGSGGTTVIIDTGNGRALRLARTSELPMDGDDETFRVDRDRLDDYLHTARELATYGLPVPKVWSEESLQSANYLGELEYVIVEKLEPEDSLNSLTGRINQLSEAESAMYLKGLTETALKASGILSVRDLHSDNIVWDTGRNCWILMDFSREVTIWDPGAGINARHIFSDVGLPGPWLKKIDEAVKQVRRRSFPAE